MFIAVTRMGVLLRNGQSNGFLRAGVGAGKAGLAVSRNVYCLPILQMNRRRRTDLFTDSTADTAICNSDQILPGSVRSLAHELKKLPVSRPVIFCYFRYHSLSSVQIMQNRGKLPFHIFINL